MAQDEAEVVRRMEVLLVQVETTKKAVATKTHEIEQLKLSRDRPVAKRADNAAIQQMQRDIDSHRLELQTVRDAVGQKESELERANQHIQDLKRKLELYNLEDRADEKRIEDLRAKNRELRSKLTKLKKELLLRENETSRGRGRLEEVQARHARLKQQEEEARMTLQQLGYSVRDLDQMRETVDAKEADLVTIEEISDMMDDVSSTVRPTSVQRDVAYH